LFVESSGQFCKLTALLFEFFFIGCDVLLEFVLWQIVVNHIGSISTVVFEWSVELNGDHGVGLG